MESELFAKVLQKIDKPTPVTEQFEKKYGQKDKRWWDKSTGSQKEHLICWFSRKHHNGSTSMCIKERNCESCYFKTLKPIPEEYEAYKEQKDAEKVFNWMGRPEMFIYIAEALQVLSEEQLKNYVDETKKAIEKDGKWKLVRQKYLTWNMVEKKALAVLQRE